MPNDPFSALVYIFLLVPGLLYIGQRESEESTKKQSAFRETATVVFVSALSLLAAFLLVMLLSVFFEDLRFWAASALANPGLMRTSHPIDFFLLLLLFLAIATALALLASLPVVHRKIRTLGFTEGSIQTRVSGWRAAFEAMPGHLVIVSVQFTNGDWVQGPLISYNSSADETTDRSLTLCGEILFMYKDQEEATALQGQQRVVIQASEIQFMSVTYQSPDDSDENVKRQRK